jgi:transposase
MARGLSFSTDWKEVRRLRALELKRRGWRQQRIAEALGVSKGAVSQWMTLVREQGKEGLRARSRSGAPPRLTSEELNLLPELLTAGAETYGFRGEVWTCARIAKLLEWGVGVAYHRAHVSRLLKQLGWTPQKPLERPAQRNEAQIVHWRLVLSK